MALARLRGADMQAAPSAPGGALTSTGAVVGPALLLLWIMVVAICAAGALLAIEMDEGVVAFHCGAVAATLMLFGVFAHEYRKTRNALSPLCLAMLLMFLLYPFHGWMTEGTGVLYETIGTDAHTWQAKALLVVTAAVPFFAWGYHSDLGRRLAKRMPTPRFVIDDTDRMTRSKLLALYLVAFLPRVAMLAAGLFFHWDAEREAIEVQFLLETLSTLPAFVTTWYVVSGVRHKQRRLLSIGLAMLAGEVMWGFVSGSRFRMFEPAVASLAALSYLHRPFGLRRLVIALMIFAVITLPFLTAFRGAYFERVETIQRDGLEVGTLVDALTEATAAPEDEFQIVEGNDPFDALANRLHGLTSLALIMRYTPERHDYMYGVPYLLIVPQVLIPRLVWPDKPDVAQFREAFRTLYWGLDPSSTTSIAVSQLGDLWANLHIAGALLGSFFYAFFIAFLFKHLRFGVKNASMFPLIVFSIHLPHLLHALEGSLDASIAGFIKSLFIYFLVAWFLNRRRPPATMAGVAT